MNAEASQAPFLFRRLAGTDAVHYRELRLEGLRRPPEAFGASWEDEASQPLPWFAERLERNAVFGAGSPGAPALAGVVGLLVPEGAKLRHKGLVWGMFLRPEAQGAGLGAALMARVLDHAAQVVEEVRLTVVTSNLAAVRLYARMGFEPYGLERRALKIGGQYHDELLMALTLNRSG